MKSEKQNDTVKTEERRQKIWLFVRLAAFVFVIVLMFSTKDIYYTGKAETAHPDFVKITVVFLTAAAAVLLPFFLHPQWPDRMTGRQRQIFYIVLIPVVLFLTLCLCEYIHGFSFLAERKRFILFNGMLAFAIFLLFHIITNRIKWGLMLTYALIIFASSLNHYVNEFRGEAVTAMDIFSIETAANVADNYEVIATPEIFWCVFAGALLLTALTWLPKELPLFRKKVRAAYDAAAAAVIVFIIWLFAVSDWPNTQGLIVRYYKPMKSYRLNGELLNFTRSFYYVWVKEPEGYSAEACRSLIDGLGYESDRADYDDGRENPNVIYIMNESLKDFSTFEEIGLSEDPLPYIHSLQGQDNTIFGNLHVDVFGGRTAITEYEVQTGNSMFFLPRNSVPYALYIKGPQPALTWNMIDMGYSGNVAFHPHHASGYSRPRAYPYLGFQRFVAIEDIRDELQPEDYLRSWVSDSADFRYIEKLYEEAKAEDQNAPFYMFNVTMQNHGSYMKDFDNFVQDIEINGEKFKNLNAISETKQFINLTQYTDEAFHELTDYFSKVKEPTILVMFGDHLPNFNNKFYKTLWGDERKFEKNTTTMLIWANYDINQGGKYNDLFSDISVNYLSAAIMKAAGLPMTAYQKYLIDLQKKLPVISTVGLLDADGNFYAEDEKTYPFDEELKVYNYLLYNYQFDTENRDDSFFTLKSE